MTQCSACRAGQGRAGIVGTKLPLIPSPIPPPNLGASDTPHILTKKKLVCKMPTFSSIRSLRALVVA